MNTKLISYSFLLSLGLFIGFMSGYTLALATTELIPLIIEVIK